MPADDRVAHVSGQPQPSSETLLARILTSLDEDKAEDVVQIDLRGKSAMGDYMIVCSGRSSRQVGAISEKVADDLEKTHKKLRKSIPELRELEDF